MEAYNTPITPDTPISQLTVGQLAEVLKDILNASPVEVPAKPEGGRRYVYGLKGIQELFHCSNVTAQRLKKGAIAAAVSQYGRKITVDADKAMELVRKAKDMDKE